MSSNRVKAPRKWLIFAGIGLGIALIVCIVVLVSKNRNASEVDLTASRPDVGGKDKPGAASTQRYNSLIFQKDQQGADEAAKRGDSYVPTITLEAKTPEPKETSEKPQSPAQAPVLQYSQHAAPPAPPPMPSEHDQRRQDNLKNFLDRLANEKDRKGMAVLSYKYDKEEKATDTGKGQETETKKTIPKELSPGAQLYAINQTAANSDVAGVPLVASILSGPLQGTRFIGSFETKDEKIVPKYTKAVLPDGTAYAVEAWGFDPKTKLPGLASDVDHHYFTRIFSLVAASMLSGYGRAAAQSGSTESIYNGSGGYSSVTQNQKYSGTTQAKIAAGEVGTRFAPLLEKNFDRPATVTLDAGDPLGILIISAS